MIDLNAQYQSFIYRLFPNAQIIIDRFHIIQLTGRALDNCRINILKFLDAHSREYKIRNPNGDSSTLNKLNYTQRNPSIYGGLTNTWLNKMPLI